MVGDLDASARDPLTLLVNPQQRQGDLTAWPTGPSRQIAMFHLDHGELIVALLAPRLDMWAGFETPIEVEAVPLLQPRGATPVVLNRRADT
ncbi:hypothetical protein D7223_31330 [Micromonospora endolithica]|uniref:Uncharacterized protein n=1 Tax=Micromonospora endolithica TaxID=230091 RepID=A0A3A9YQD3_9ACTN|nr:hypothetical protein D7223_31330 [Micromonospora endolithica]